MTDDITDTLLDMDGVEEIHVETKITVTHRKEHTGESFQDIPEQVVSDEEFESIAQEFGWDYHGTIDVVGDFYLRDKFSNRYTEEDD